ncbi:MAG: tetratricopeptide repeat protein, partial [Treponema sp.]|nr:tetratricopeptide repeat protein [Treponema sp.]
MRETSETLNNQAIELASKGEYKEAIACFIRAISMERQNYLLWFNLGITYRDAGNLEDAKNAIHKAHLMNPYDEEVIESLAIIC